MRAFNPFSVEDGEDVADALVERVGRGIVRRVAAALAAGIEEDEAIGVTQSPNLTSVLAAPIFETSKEADVKDQRWPAALDLIVNADAVVVGVRHRWPSPSRRCSAGRFAPTLIHVGATTVESWQNGELSRRLSCKLLARPVFETRSSPAQPRLVRWRLALVPSHCGARRDRR